MIPRKIVLFFLISIFLFTAAMLLSYTVELPHYISSKPNLDLKFDLVSHRGQKVTQENFKDKWIMIYFGFTHCPHVCPTALQKIDNVTRELSIRNVNIQPVFVSIDPERDKPNRLSLYLSRFSGDMLGLTGETDEIHALARSLMVYSQKIDSHQLSGNYEVDHSRFIYLMNLNKKRLLSVSDSMSDEKIINLIVSEIYP